MASPGLTVNESGILFRRTIAAVELLLRTIDSNKNGLTAFVRGFQDNLKAILPLINQLAAVVRSNEGDVVLKPEVQYILENCERICSEHSNNLRLLHTDEVTTLEMELKACQAGITTLLQTSSYLKTARQDFMSRDMVEPLLKQAETNLKKRLVEINDDQATLQRLPLVKTSNKQEKMQVEVRHLKKSYEAVQKICEDALRRTMAQRAVQKISKVKATDRSYTFTGFVNADSDVPKLSQDITDVTASSYSIAVAGVVRQVDYVGLSQQMRQNAHVGS